MKRFLALLLALSLLLTLAACGKSDKKDREEGKDSEKQTQDSASNQNKDDPGLSEAEALLKTLREAPESPVEDFEYEVNDNGVTVTRYNGKDEWVVVPATIEDKPVTEIGGYAFSANYIDDEILVRGVCLPESVTVLGSYAFFAKESLEAVICQGVTEIPESAFFNASSLKAVSLSENILSLGNYAFAGTALETLYLPVSLSYMTGSSVILGPELLLVDEGSYAQEYCETYALAHCVKAEYDDLGSRTPTREELEKTEGTAITLEDGQEVTAEMVRSHPVSPVSDFTYEVVNGGIVITGYTGSDAIVVIPAMIEEKPVAMVRYGAFEEHSEGLYGLYIPSTVTGLSWLTNRGSNLEVLVAPGVKMLFGATFWDHSFLHTLCLSEELYVLNLESVQFCDELRELKIAENAVFLEDLEGESYFEGCENIVLIGEAGGNVEAYANHFGHNFSAGSIYSGGVWELWEVAAPDYPEPVFQEVPVIEGVVNAHIMETAFDYDFETIQKLLSQNDFITSRYVLGSRHGETLRGYVYSDIGAAHAFVLEDAVVGAMKQYYTESTTHLTDFEFRLARDTSRYSNYHSVTVKISDVLPSKENQDSIFAMLKESLGEELATYLVFAESTSYGGVDPWYSDTEFYENDHFTGGYDSDDMYETIWVGDYCYRFARFIDKERKEITFSATYLPIGDDKNYFDHYAAGHVSAYENFKYKPEDVLPAHSLGNTDICAHGTYADGLMNLVPETYSYTTPTQFTIAETVLPDGIRAYTFHADFVKGSDELSKLLWPEKELAYTVYENDDGVYHVDFYLRGQIDHHLDDEANLPTILELVKKELKAYLGQDFDVSAITMDALDEHGDMEIPITLNLLGQELSLSLKAYADGTIFDTTSGGYSIKAALPE